MKDFVFVKNDFLIPLPDKIAICEASEMADESPAEFSQNSAFADENLAEFKQGKNSTEITKKLSENSAEFIKNESENSIKFPQNSSENSAKFSQNSAFSSQNSALNPPKIALISNEKSSKAQIYAPEINFYLKNSQDDYLAKAQNTLLLYEARASVFDLGLDLDYEKQVGSRVIIASATDKSPLCELLRAADFKVVQVDRALSVYGAVGELAVIVQEKGEEVEIECDFFLYDAFQPSFDRQSGCYDLQKFSNDNALLAFLQSKSPIYRYKNFTNYDSSICQLHQRREECCGACAEICPTVAILKDGEKRELVFSQVDCTGCGDCVSVCPSGSLEFAPLPRASFWALLDFYRGKKIVIFDEDFELESLEIALPAGVLPLVLKTAQLNETTLLALLQSSGASVVLCVTRLSRGNEESIALLNEIFERKFKKKAVFVAFDKENLQKALQKCEFIENLSYEMPKNSMLKREHFAKRLAHIVGEDDLGVVKSGEWVRYGQIKVDESRCTLCLACVGACNVGALVADAKDHSLKFNASLCTTCGYCVSSCAEPDTIALERSGIELKADYFAFRVLAQDELFKCVECGKEFATKKAVERVASLMRDKFASNEKKLKTLYCCTECKAKLMIFN